MKKNNSYREELEKLSPLLAKLKKEAPDQEVPRNYFHNMQVEVLQHLKEEINPDTEKVTNGKNPKVPWYQIFFTPRFALAFSTLLVLAVGVYWFSDSAPVNQDAVIAMDDLSQEEILQYIEENIASFEADELVEVAPPSQSNSDLFQEVDLDEEAVDEYLDKIIDDLDEESFENIF